MPRTVSLSSTTNTDSPSRVRPRAAVRTATPLPDLVNFAVNQKVEPAPGALSTPMLPPICSTNLRAIASPRPVPSWGRPPSWIKARKSCACLFRDADAGVAHLKAQRRLARRLTNPAGPQDDLALLGELDRVTEQVGEHLAQTPGVAPEHPRRTGFDRH